MPTKSSKCAKLCKRTFFLRNESAPTQSEMRHELGSGLANVILGSMSPACKVWMGTDRTLLGPSVYCVDSDDLKANIHEHILHVGKKAEIRLERRRRRMVKKVDNSEELEFIKFESRQKIEIARDEERKKMEQQLQKAKVDLDSKFRIMKAELGHDYLRGRREMAKFMCRNLRKQARDLIASIARQYRIELEQEVSSRVNQEVQRLQEQIEGMVCLAVEQQKAVDSKAMQDLCYRYEDLIKNIQHRQACRELTTLSEKICSRWVELAKPANVEISCQTSLILMDSIAEIDSGSIGKSEGFEEPSEYLENDDIFVIETCVMTPGPSPVYSFAGSSSENETILSSMSTLAALDIDGKIYAQPKYYRKIHEQLFPAAVVSWEPMEFTIPVETSTEEPPGIDSDFAKEIVQQILANDDMSEQEALTVNLESEILLPREPNPSVTSNLMVSKLFDVETTESAIDIVVNGITLKYIRATEKDLEKIINI